MSYSSQVLRSARSILLVNVYRPEEEHAGIVAHQVVPLGAKVLWLQPSVGSDAARQLAADYALELVAGINIAEVARNLET